MNATRIPFLSLTPAADEAEVIRRAIDRVMASGQFILGPEVEAFEAEFAAASGAKHAVGVGNGTDGLALVLRSMRIGPGDEVITTPFTAAFTALAILMVGATPVFADIDPVRLTIDPAQIARHIGPKTRAILPVHLYGQPADMAPIRRLATDHKLALIEDCCQAHLATETGKPVGTIGGAGVFSFYPTKNLGALGDGGAIILDDEHVANHLRSLRNGGQTSRNVHEFAGVNTRLDELQAAILRAKLPGLAAATARRRTLAALYRDLLRNAPVDVPPECDPGHVYHLFVIRSRERDALQAHLAKRGIETLIHYPEQMHGQHIFKKMPHTDTFAATDAADQVLSLPLYPSLTEDGVARVAAAIKDFR